MEKMKKLICVFLAVLTVALSFACSKDGDAGDETGKTSGTESTGTETEEVTDDLPEKDFDGASFIIWTYENANMLYPTLCEEQSDDVVEEAMYRACTKLEDRFKIDLDEIVLTAGVGEGVATYSEAPTAGLYEYDVANVRCTFTANMWSNDLIVTFDDIPYVDLTKPYWNQSANDALTINNVHFAAIGGYSVATYSLVHAMLFNKTLASDIEGIPDMYAAVKDGTWTLDAMTQVMKLSIKDLDGNSTMDENDRYGYLSHYKEALPNFWIAGGVKSIKKDENDIPYSNLSDAEFNDAFVKIFEALWDTGAWYKGNDWAYDVPDSCIDMFENEQTMFLDTTFHVLGKIRNVLNIEYGILPYPKMDENKDYISRVEYYNSQVVPVGVEDLERTGIILEALNCEYYKQFLPAYYEKALKRKYTVDTDSEEMLEIIFNTMTIDIGDTTLCDRLRDGLLMQLFLTNKRTLSSIAARCDNQINGYIEDMYGV